MATQNDRFNIYAQLEHLQSKHVGTGNPDITKLYVGSLVLLRSDSSLASCLHLLVSVIGVVFELLVT